MAAAAPVAARGWERRATGWRRSTRARTSILPAPNHVRTNVPKAKARHQALISRLKRSLGWPFLLSVTARWSARSSAWRSRSLRCWRGSDRWASSDAATSSDPEPVVHLDQEDVLRRPAEQRPGVVAEIDRAARERRGAAAGPHQVECRARPIFPAQHRVAPQRAEREARIDDHEPGGGPAPVGVDRKSTRLNSSHGYISYAVFCLKKKKPRHDGIACIPILISPPYHM